MKYAWVVLTAASLAAILSVQLAGNSRASQTGDPNAAAKPSAPVVIVELFTSEGCSSCPPADLLLKRLSEEQPVHGAQVVALEEHVDYWNHLGWSDPYSSAEFTRRQEDYVSVFHNATAYTPQMIVDGQTEVTATQASKAIAAIEESSHKTRVKVAVSQAAGSSESAAAFDISVSNAAAGAGKHGLELWLAVTECGLQSDVKAGENSGETLKHAAVVRSLHKVADVRGDGALEKAVSVNVSKQWKRDQLSVVAFVAQKDTRKIVGAGISSFAPRNLN
jgi:hypothetical protein